MVAGNIQSAVGKLQSETIKARSEGLEELQRVLGQSSRSRLEALKDAALHSLFESLFRVARLDIPTYLNGTAAAATKAEKRLESTASCLSLLAELFVSRIRHKTAFAVLDHIVDTLPTRDEELCKPLRNKYLKAFRTIVEYAPHGEHLKPKSWQSYVDFVLEGISGNLSRGDEESTPRSGGDRSINSNHNRSISVRVSQASSNRSHRPDSNSYTDDFFAVLKALTSVTNCPLSSRWEAISDMMLRVLEQTDRCAEVAFEVLNNTFVVALSEKFSSCAHLLRRACIPIRRLWSPLSMQSRSVQLRDQMLAFLFLAQPLVPEQFSAERNSSDQPLERLTNTMFTTLADNAEKELLRLNELKLSEPGSSHLFSRDGISPNNHSTLAVTKWTLISLVGGLLSELEKLQQHSDRVSENAAPRKRQRRDGPIADLVRQRRTGTLASKAAAVQIELFMPEITIHDEFLAPEFLEQLATSLSDDQESHKPWILLLLSRITCHPSARNLDLQPIWRRIWTASSGLLIHANTSRCASFLMSALLTMNLIESRSPEFSIHESVFPHGTLGPHGLTDAGILLFISCLESRQLETERDFELFATRVLTWLDSHWTLPAVVDISQNDLVATHGQSNIIYRLLLAVSGRKSCCISRQPYSIPNVIYKVNAIADDMLTFTKFSLGHNDDTLTKQRSPNSDEEVSIFESLSRRLSIAIIDMLYAKVNGFRENFIALHSERIGNINVEICEIVTTLCSVASSVHIMLTSATHTEDLTISVAKLWTNICDYVLQQTNTSLPDLTVRIARRILDIEEAENSTNCSISMSRKSLTESLLLIMQHAEDRTTLEIDVLDMNQPDHSQDSQRTTSRSGLFPMQDTQVSFDQAACLLMIDSQGEQRPYNVQAVSNIVDYVTALEPVRLMSIRPILQSFFKSNELLKRDDARRLLERIGTVCLQQDEYVRNETALCLCIDVMKNTACLWTTSDEDDLANKAFEIYEWLIEIVLGKNIASGRVLFNLAQLLEAILQWNASYGSDILASPRTNLLKILRDAPICVKFLTAPMVAKVFDGYVLTEHGAIFDDVVDSLPVDREHTEGIALRVYVLAFLGARWHTILRQAVYHMFETAANIPAIQNIALRCAKLICGRIGIKTPQELLQLFCPQIFYTWLDRDQWETIPFVAFGYHSLQDLLHDLEPELVAQVAMRLDESQIALIQGHLGQNWKDSLTYHFAQATVYAIATDLITHHSLRNMGKLEGRIRDEFGPETYAAHAKSQLPQMVAHVFLSLSDDRGFERAFSNSQEGNNPRQTLEGICVLSSSTIELPARQQPCFRAKYTVQILNKVCASAGMELSSIWTPALLVHVYRTLFNDAKPALGPLYAAAMIRKIRMVVALTGPSTLTGYPLEMLLHNIQPYLTQFHCAEDAFGVFSYLLAEGSNYLNTKFSLVAGLSVPTFIALSHFTSSSQESTTQEIQFLSTMDGAQKLRLWLAQYLSATDTSQLDQKKAQTFSEITQLARDATIHANNSKNSPEGNLLYHLLIDQASTVPLLTQTSFKISIRSLVSEFKSVEDKNDDIFSDPRDLALVAPKLWSLLQEENLGRDFRIWAAETLGRAYALEGPSLLSPLYSREATNSKFLDCTLDADDSKTKLIEALVAITQDQDQYMAAVAEKALSSVMSRLESAERQNLISSNAHRQMLNDLVFEEMTLKSYDEPSLGLDDQDILNLRKPEDASDRWASKIAIALCLQRRADVLLASLIPVLSSVTSFARTTLPFIVHLVIVTDVERTRSIRESLALLFGGMLEENDQKYSEHLRIILDILLYLRCCAVSGETTTFKRNVWIPVNFENAATVAATQKMPHCALLLLEVHRTQTTINHSNRNSTRSSMTNANATSQELLATIYGSVDDPDFFYGSRSDSNISSILEKLHHEGQGAKALAFQSALLDSDMRSVGFDDAVKLDRQTTVATLTAANLHGLSTVIGQFAGGTRTSAERITRDESLLNVHQWDLARDDGDEESLSLLRVFQTLSWTPSKLRLGIEADAALLKAIRGLTKVAFDRKTASLKLAVLATVSELREILSSHTVQTTAETWDRILERTSWGQQYEFATIAPILAGREAIFAAARRNGQLGSVFHLEPTQALLFEAKAVRASLKFAHRHDVAQFCLNRALYLSKLSEDAVQADLRLNAAIQYDLANTFWAQGEVSLPIRTLQQLQTSSGLEREDIPISRADVLTDLGQKLIEARLERPDEVTTRYLIPAIKALGKDFHSSRAGRVYHNFAAFCDNQLQDSATLDDFIRIETIRERKQQEVADLEAMLKKGEIKNRDSIKMHYVKAKTWFKLDNEEWLRLKANREQLLEQSLENYLLSLSASDEFGNDILRFLALWLSQSGNQNANHVVEKYLSKVPTSKFAPLMNQLSSRMLNNQSDTFQKILFELMYRICCDHPYHSLYQLFATSKSKGARGDDVATSRHAAAGKLAQLVQVKGASKNIWIAVHNSNIAFVRLAQEKIPEKEAKTGAKILLRRLPLGAKLEQTIHDLHSKIPPPTLNIALRVDRNYASVPVLHDFDPQISIAGGISAPKILTLIASDGSRHKMLLKGGNDDLRQDAIMEQVFEQVSELLKDHRPTRERKLGIRTYKVIPLTHNAGIIEFVRNTIPLHDYLLPAHTRYFPKDFKPNRCRKDIQDAQSKNSAHRLAAYKTVTANFQPVMRFFFMERFMDPDEWFQKRLNYSRSTAAISMLGHVLGLGDRHGHNILLDEQTGEVIHIDLGVAFEAGRVLPVPEVVPFRLTRDLVDGMGMSGVEGPFRRCCEFTLEALRKNQEAITTILDVLRWDPLYSWSISPLRLQRMQENQEQAAAEAAAAATVSVSTDGEMLTEPGSRDSRSVTPSGLGAGKRDINEPSEADRALTVVAKKLSASLSVQATVNELIRQATDERNLAVLYCGWAAYA